MGKPYESEIEKFEMTYSWAQDNPIEELTSFLQHSAKTPLYVIGSGGSFTATAFATLLHQQIGTMAKCLTPLEFFNYDNIGKDNSILIVTAGGNNKDILTAFDKAILLESKNLGILCASINNKLTKKAEQIPRVFLNQAEIPTKKDGFLATNSLIALSIWLLRAYAKNFSLGIVLPNELSKLIHPDTDKINFRKVLEEKLSDFKSTVTIVVLYDNWGKTAAIDLESKLVEAGLFNVQLADYRNFAHGRHNWIGKNLENTGIVSLINPDCDTLAKKTLNLIPAGIPIAEINTKYSGPVGALSLLIQIMYIVKIFGDFKKVDPGRPRVATFGRKIYHLGIPKTKSKRKIEEISIERKFGKIEDKETFEIKLEALRKFLKKLETTTFDSIVFDYDGTLCDLPNRFKSPSAQTIEMLVALLEKEIPIGIATGRGKSVRNELQQVIPEKFWSKILIGYYNCADIAELGSENKPDVDKPTDPALTEFMRFLKKNQIVSKKIESEERPNQISLSVENMSALDLIKEINSINPKILDAVKIVESSHSLDIISKEVSKINLLKKLEKKFGTKKILCIGDRGLWPGNDYELLSTPYSLSVDEVNKEPESCWNISPVGNKGEQATKYYFESMILQNKKIQIKQKYKDKNYER